MNGILRWVLSGLVTLAILFGLVAAAVGPGPAGNLAGQTAKYGGVGAGVTVGSIPVFFDAYQVGTAEVGDAGPVAGQTAETPAP